MKRALKRGVNAVALLCLVIALVVVALIGWQAAREAMPASAPANGVLIATREGPLFVQSFGPPKGRPVLIVGGTASWSGLWRPVAEKLAVAGYRAIAVDLPPFGFSAYPANGDYSRARQAQRLVALMDAMALKQPIVLGHSYGGGPVLEMALLRPGELGGLVLVDPALGRSEAGQAAAGQAQGALSLVQSPWIAKLAVELTLTNPFAMRPLLASSLAKKDAATPERVALLRKPQARPGTVAAIAAWLPALVLPDGSGLSASDAAIAAMTTKTALIWGAEDALTPLAQGESFKRLRPATRLDTIAGVGHFPQLENEPAFTEVLLARLEDFGGP